MEELQEAIRNLLARGWTLAALADELGVHYFTIARWRDGVQFPSNAKAVLAMLHGLERKKRIPLKKRYATAREGKGTVPGVR